MRELLWESLLHLLKRSRKHAAALWLSAGVKLCVRHLRVRGLGSIRFSWKQIRNSQHGTLFTCPAAPCCSQPLFATNVLRLTNCKMADDSRLNKLWSKSLSLCKTARRDVAKLSCSDRLHLMATASLGRLCGLGFSRFDVRRKQIRNRQHHGTLFTCLISSMLFSAIICHFLVFDKL